MYNSETYIPLNPEDENLFMFIFEDDNFNNKTVSKNYLDYINYLNDLNNRQQIEEPITQKHIDYSINENNKILLTDKLYSLNLVKHKPKLYSSIHSKNIYNKLHNELYNSPNYIESERLFVTKDYKGLLNYTKSLNLFNNETFVIEKIYQWDDCITPLVKYYDKIDYIEDFNYNNDLIMKMYGTGWYDLEINIHPFYGTIEYWNYNNECGEDYNSDNCFFNIYYDINSLIVASYNPTPYDYIRSYNLNDEDIVGDYEIDYNKLMIRRTVNSKIPEGSELYIYFDCVDR